eukprot:3753241-Rhodomonas_salina.1
MTLRESRSQGAVSVGVTCTSTNPEFPSPSHRVSTIPVSPFTRNSMSTIPKRLLRSGSLDHGSDPHTSLRMRQDCTRAASGRPT